MAEPSYIDVPVIDGTATLPDGITVESTAQVVRLPIEPTHWRCPDCRQPCRCSPDVAARNLPHERCGITPGSRL